MATEQKIALFTILGALIGSAIGAYATLKAKESEAGSQWDLKRTEMVLNEAREDFNNNKEIPHSAWVCYHSIIWDCANQEWSVTNPPNPILTALCPPKPAQEYESNCPVRTVSTDKRE